MMTELQISNVDGITRAALQGRLDSGTVDRIELSFTAGIVPVGDPDVQRPLRAAVGAPSAPRELQMAPSESVEHATYALSDGRGHRFAWELDLTQVTLANFNYKKMSLVQDYNQLIEDGGASAPFDQVFSIQPRISPPAADSARVFCSCQSPLIRR